MLDEIDDAIVRYHEVCLSAPKRKLHKYSFIGPIFSDVEYRTNQWTCPRTTQSRLGDERNEYVVPQESDATGRARMGEEHAREDRQGQRESDCYTGQYQSGDKYFWS